MLLCAGTAHSLAASSLRQGIASIICVYLRFADLDGYSGIGSVPLSRRLKAQGSRLKNSLQANIAR